MAILVTGGEGYIGSHCVIALLDAGYNVVIFDNESTGHAETGEALMKIESKGRLEAVYKGDLLVRDDLDAAFEIYRIDAVIHFAAFSQVAESMSDPAKYYRNNVAGTMNLLDSMVAHNVKRIVFSSTAATYGEPDYTPIDEKHPQNPINPYGRTKLDIEYMMDDYDRAYGLKSVRLRYFNVAGADSQNRVGEVHEPETHLITCVRDYVNVEDLCDAHVLALRYLELGGETDFFNLGTNEGSTVKEVFAECEKVTGKRIPVKIEGRRPGDPAVLVADNAKAKRVLGWRPHRDLAHSIETAYRWEFRND